MTVFERTANMQLRMLSLYAERIADIALSGTEQTAPERTLLKPDKPAQLDIHDLTFQYDALSTPLINYLSFSVASGECLAITGPSGKGKITLMKILAGLL